MSVYDDLRFGNKTAIRDKTTADSITPGDVADRLDALVGAVSNVDTFSEVVFDTANSAQAIANNAYTLASDAEDLGLNADIKAATALDTANSANATANAALTAAQQAASGVFNSDVTITGFLHGWVLESPNGTKARVTLNDDLSFTITPL